MVTQPPGGKANKFATYKSARKFQGWMNNIYCPIYLPKMTKIYGCAMRT